MGRRFDIKNSSVAKRLDKEEEREELVGEYKPSNRVLAGAVDRLYEEDNYGKKAKKPASTVQKRKANENVKTAVTIIAGIIAIAVIAAVFAM